jgi:trigger factor
MSIKSKEPIGPCEVSLDIEVESGKVADAVDKAYREFSKYVAVPGFRKGRAPMAFVKQRVPQDQLRERTAEILVGPAYDEAIKETEIKAYARPRVELVKMETTPPDYVFEFKAIVPLPPAVTLGQYVGLELEREREEVTDADVESAIAAMQERAADYPIVEDRASQAGDVVAGELSVTFEDADSDGEFKPVAITVGEPGNVPGVDEAVTGVRKGEEREFELVYPADYANAEIAGKRGKCILRVKELHSRIVPALDDAFAKKYGDAETMDELRVQTRAEIEKSRLDRAESALESRIVTEIVNGSTVEYPSVMLDVEMEDDIRAFREDLERRGSTVSEYLQHSDTSEEELINTFRTRADIRLRRGLVLGEIVRLEHLELTDEDVEKEIQRRADAQRTTVQAVRAYLDRSDGMSALRESAYLKKILAFLKAASTIKDKVTTKQSAEPAAAKPAKPKRTAKKKESAAEPAADAS